MPWVKGQSGNPGGMPKGVAEVAQLARQVAPEVIARLTKIALNSKNERAAIAAGEVLLERGFGKPIQPVDTGASLNDLLSLDEQRTLADALRAAVGKQRDAAEPNRTQH